MKFLPLTLSIILFAGVLSGYVFLVGSIQSGVDQAAIFIEKSESLTKRDASSRSMQAFLNNSKEEIAELSSYVSGEGDVVSAIELMEDTAKDEKVSISISNVGVKDVEGWKYHEGIEVNFSASGTFSRMISFILMLESLPVASSLSGVNLEVSSEGEWFGVFSLIFVKEK